MSNGFDKTGIAGVRGMWSVAAVAEVGCIRLILRQAGRHKACLYVEGMGKHWWVGTMVGKNQSVS